ncbi:pre-rRNA-processing protein TSR2 homolog [Mizuhopecten yessoensis]|uniref:pre-rRNA-processing protein TSR2 homolog n=1 Tax=Mizuhopecten yessoensis TaxID=6573 RepID=UPI000B45F071|nr:pre-rRNA-processing protein TSR2 homolog [Mizuhopecten yessoensis]
MAASTENTLFQTAVQRVLDSWTVLQLAVGHGFGGGESREKAQWMVYAIDQWFKENKNIETYELENFLEDVMNHEFDTIIDDGSLPRISTLVCGMYRLSCEGREEELQQRLQSLPQPQVQQCARAPSDGEDEDDEDVNDAMETGGASAPPPPPSQSTSQSEQGSGRESQSADPMEEEEDGWQVVRKAKRR